MLLCISKFSKSMLLLPLSLHLSATLTNTHNSRFENVYPLKVLKANSGFEKVTLFSSVAIEGHFIFIRCQFNTYKKIYHNEGYFHDSAFGTFCHQLIILLISCKTTVSKNIALDFQVTDSSSIFLLEYTLETFEILGK